MSDWTIPIRKVSSPTLAEPCWWWSTGDVKTFLCADDVDEFFDLSRRRKATIRVSVKRPSDGDAYQVRLARGAACLEVRGFARRRYLINAARHLWGQLDIPRGPWLWVWIEVG